MTRAVFNTFTPEHRALQSETVRAVVASRYGSTRPLAPAGMRGSIPERVALAGRLAKGRAAEGRWESLRRRHQEEGMDPGDYDYMDEEPETHPVTGLPSWGAVHTFAPRYGGDPEAPNIGMEHGAVPGGLSFHGSAPSARRRAGTEKWIPTVGLRTPQDTVSASRVHEAMEDESTRYNPRVPFRELPHVYESTGQRPGERTYTLIDGNHRASANILQGKMFMEANVLTDADIPHVQEMTRRISEAKTRAARRTDPDFVESRMNRNIYGTGNW
jgi:hypothetical protein